MADAIVLAGAAAKGAWSAGVLAELTSTAAQARLGLDIRRVVAVSAGAINGALLAAHVRDATEGSAMALLEELWITVGDTKGVLDVSPRAILARRGISSSKKVRALLERYIPPRPSGSRPVDLAIVVANLDGEVDIVGSELATTYERCVQFTGDALASKEGLASVFDAVIASAAFPVLFEPESITLGARRVRCMDGGTVNNTPIKYALGAGEEIDRVFLIAPFPSVQRTAPSLSGVGLLSHLGEIFVEERLFRDLRTAHEVNRQLRALERVLPIPAVREEVLRALDWEGRRVVKLVEIRPKEALEGSILSGFFSKRLRQDYVRQGREAARGTALGAP